MRDLATTALDSRDEFGGLLPRWVIYERLKGSAKFTHEPELLLALIAGFSISCDMAFFDEIRCHGVNRSKGTLRIWIMVFLERFLTWEFDGDNQTRQGKDTEIG